MMNTAHNLLSLP